MGRKSALGSSSLLAGDLTQSIERTMPLFPPMVTKMLRYSSNTGILSSTSGAVATYVIRSNDCFDPDFTGTGHQPMGFDQMMVFYNHFCVRKARIKCTFRSISGIQSTACVRIDASSTPLTVIDRIMEFGGLVSTDLNRTDVYGSMKTVMLSLDVARLQGITSKALTADPTLRGDAATSPTEISYFHIALWDANAVTNTAFVDFVLEQLVTFMEPRDATESFTRAANLRPPLVISSSPLSEEKAFLSQFEKVMIGDCPKMYLRTEDIP
jgi:hypothetical protein